MFISPCNKYRNLCIKLLTNEMPYKEVTSIACIRTKRIYMALVEEESIRWTGNFASLWIVRCRFDMRRDMDEEVYLIVSGWWWNRNRLDDIERTDMRGLRFQLLINFCSKRWIKGAFRRAQSFIVGWESFAGWKYELKIFYCWESLYKTRILLYGFNDCNE